jgi:hypothetical protein
MAPLGQGDPPRIHALVGRPPSRLVVRQSPPQVIVWVQDDPVGQGFPPTMQDVGGGGGACVAIHAPRHTSVWVQIAPCGHGEPPRMHG